MDETKARLRNTFKYPSDSEDSSNASRDEMDEEEQDSLLTTLTTNTTKNDTRYRILFTALPLASTLPFLTHLLHSNRTTALPALLSITSLGISAFSMYTVQTDTPLGRAGRRPSTIFSQPPSIPGAGASPSRLDAQGPLLRYLPYLNLTLALLLLLLSFLFTNRDISPSTSTVSEGFWLLLLLPAVMLGVVSVVQGSMAEIDRGLGELRGLKYEYKGA